jgi:anti-sigma regulatory factor (Ser/Thr protein kinase)
VVSVDPLRVELGNSDRAPGTARRLLEPWLNELDCGEDVAEGALIVLSELVTNAVTHTTTDAVVVATFDDQRLRLEVHDGDPRGPVAATRATAGGFGLTIVAALCDAWGWEPTTLGKRVWTETLC